MKLRFGQQQASLHACDVMMRDIKDSERIRTAISKILPKQAARIGLNLPLQQLNTCIVSKGYWDTMTNVEDQTQQLDGQQAFNPPPFLKKAFDEFA